MAEETRELSRVSLIRALIPFLRALPSWPTPLQKAPPPNTFTLRVRISISILGEQTSSAHMDLDVRTFCHLFPPKHYRKQYSPFNMVHNIFRETMTHTENLIKSWTLSPETKKERERVLCKTPDILKLTPKTWLHHRTKMWSYCSTRSVPSSLTLSTLPGKSFSILTMPSRQCGNLL